MDAFCQLTLIFVEAFCRCRSPWPAAATAQTGHSLPILSKAGRAPSVSTVVLLHYGCLFKLSRMFRGEIAMLELISESKTTSCCVASLGCVSGEILLPLP